MPMITVRYVTPDNRDDLRPAIAKAASHVAATMLGKDPAVTAVLVEAADPGSWFIAGANPTRNGLSAFWLDIKITAGTNTKADHAAFVTAMFQAMSEILGELHPESYVLVHAVDGDAYGYQGRTQNARWAVAHPG